MGMNFYSLGSQEALEKLALDRDTLRALLAKNPDISHAELKQMMAAESARIPAGALPQPGQLDAPHPAGGMDGTAIRPNNVTLDRNQLMEMSQADVYKSLGFSPKPKTPQMPVATGSAMRPPPGSGTVSMKAPTPPMPKPSLSAATVATRMPRLR